MSDCPPEFLVKSTGGAFKKKDPTCYADFVLAVALRDEGKW
jgi:hypothetical protein